MSIGARLTIRVRSSRGSSTIQFSSNGRYISLPTNTINTLLQQQPLQPTASETAFWTSVLGVVRTSIGGIP